MKLNLRHLLIFLGILALSIGFGFAFDGIADAIERKSYPRPSEFEAIITENAEKYGVPEAVLWAMARTESDFASNLKRDDGRIGLMQLSPRQFQMIQTEILGEDAADVGMLYDPATNLRCGAAYLSHLYQRYGVWETVFAAWTAGTDQTDAWLNDGRYSDDKATLHDIPDQKVADFVKRATDALEMYTKLYY